MIKFSFIYYKTKNYHDIDEIITQIFIIKHVERFKLINIIYYIWHFENFTRIDSNRKLHYKNLLKYPVQFWFKQKICCKT